MKRVIAGIACVPLVIAGVGLAWPANASPAPFFTLVWEADIAGTVFGQSSPLLQDLNADGVPDVIVGAHNGRLYAYDGATGSFMWSGAALSSTSGIDSSPSAADIDGDGKPEIFVGSGMATSDTGPGALLSFRSDGTRRFATVMDDGKPSNPQPGIHSSPVIGDIDRDGLPDVTFGTLDIDSIWSVDTNGNRKVGFPYPSGDTNFSTPALADLDGDGVTDFVIGNDQTPPTPGACGTIRGITGTGAQLFQKNMTEIVRSSPAVGDIDGDGTPEIVVGTGNNWSNSANTTAASQAACPGAVDSTNIFVLRPDGSVKRTIGTGGNTFPSPILADWNGDGRRDIIIGTSTQTRPANLGGQVIVYDGASGAELSRNFAGGSREDIVAGVSAADFDGDGKQDVAVSTGSGTYVRQGGTGALIGQVNVGQLSSQATPSIADMDGNGRLDMVTASFKPGGGAVLQRWQTTTARGAVSAMSWPTFHHDNRRTGNVNPPPLVQAPVDYCSSDAQGYWMTAADGGVYSFCKPFYGSTGGIRLNQPVVGMAPTPSGNGYWLVASDGGVFPFGDAAFYGSTGSTRLNQPIVSIVPSKSGHGYSLIARDGGVFAFGDATYRGSTGAIVLNQPIVAAASTASGSGYWLVAADGGVFSFGDAAFLGSTGGTRLNRPIVAAVATKGNGYELVASDGGVFSFGDAPFLGSTGAIALNKPIVATAFTSTGAGYWMFASDGGVFSFGDAAFKGSLGRKMINAPVIAAARG
ncbi:MAG: VCBS repeat-containing protein [Candidatus Saccharibacteria bacterium]|nr:VCBS repeat-containing protein [Microbacteriaceae bacterium]